MDVHRKSDALMNDPRFGADQFSFYPKNVVAFDSSSCR
jgi:hypothetical protein